MPEYRFPLLTGAAGALGRWLRPHLVQKHGKLRVSDKVDPGPAAPGEQVVLCDIGDPEGVDALVAGCDVVLHFGAISVEATWQNILPANIVGAYNVFEAARRHGVKRIVFASSNHAIGFHPITERLDATAPVKPDTLYGMSKAYGEVLGSYFWERYGIECACLRIGSALPEPRDPRHLSTWLSYPDLFRLIEACLVPDKLGFTILYGCSANTRAWWDNSRAAHVPYDPQDNAEAWAAKLLPDPRDPDAPTTRFQGGPFCQGWVPR
jgi:uronate dehydrogenase